VAADGARDEAEGRRLGGRCRLPEELADPGDVGGDDAGGPVDEGDGAAVGDGPGVGDGEGDGAGTGWVGLTPGTSWLSLSENVQPSKPPGIGRWVAAPTVLKVHGPPLGADQYSQCASCGGVCWHCSV
jgi:hypothetical protein